MPRRRDGWRSLFALTFVLSWTARGEEWPRWRGPRGDGISHEAAGETWPAGGLPESWRVHVGVGYSSPIGVGGRIYLFQASSEGATETLTAYDADSGHVIWSQSTDGGFNGGITGSFPGTRATPVVDGPGHGIFTFGASGDLIRRDLATGNLLWRTNVLKETGARNLDWGTASSPLVDGGSVYVQGGSDGPVVIAVAEATGRISWTAAFHGTSGVSVPVVVEAGGRRQLIVLTDENIVAMDPHTGATLWTEPWYNGFATPIIRGDRMFVTGAHGPGDAVFKLSATGIQRVWGNHGLTSRFNPPVLDGDYLYGNSEGALRCMGWTDGSLLWSAPKVDYHLGFGGSVVRTGDKLILLGDHGLLSLVRATPQGQQRLAQVQLFDGDQNWATPLLYRGRLYVRGGTELIALRIASNDTSKP
jgi:outer membrane protein assembly factor BamB